MNDFSSLRNILGQKSEGVRIGTIAETQGDAAIVCLDSGALRKVYGSASVGDRVTVKGDRILSKVAAGSEKTVYVA